MKQTRNGRKAIFAYSILALLEDEFIFNIFKVWKDESNMDNINNKKTFIRQYIFPGSYAYFQM